MLAFGLEISNIAALFGLRNRELSLLCSDRLLCDLAFVLPDIQTLATALNFHDSLTNRIQMNNPYSSAGQAFEMLRRWKERHFAQHTLRSLLDAFAQVDIDDDLLELPVLDFVQRS